MNLGSDEISLVFPLTYDEEKKELLQKTLDFGGKVNKLITLSASFASVQFYKHLIRQKYELPQDQRVLLFINAFDKLVLYFIMR
jgi:tRNA(His) 5'-end guanylyltransferase